MSGRASSSSPAASKPVPTLATASGAAGSGAVAGVDFRPFGTTVRFLPIVLGGGRIYLEVEPQFSSPTRRTCSRADPGHQQRGLRPHHPARLQTSVCCRTARPSPSAA